jgi:hypothetical protein
LKLDFQLRGRFWNTSRLIAPQFSESNSVIASVAVAKLRAKTRNDLTKHGLTCGAVFSRACCLTKHAQTHTGKKPDRGAHLYEDILKTT